ncbi:dyslexia-associated protein KIAA0319-like protein homolog isoform X1 [Prionailurus iriomotensis]
MLTNMMGLTVTDSDGATDSTTAVLAGSGAVDHPPVANAGPNQTITLPQNAMCLNGNWSSDDHHIVLYEWSLGPGSESKEVAMQGIKTPYLHLSEMQEGNYTLQLMEINRPPVAVAGPDKELVFPVGSTTLDGSRSRDDQGIALYHREPVRSQAAVEMGNSDKAVATVSGLPVGMHRFRLTVTGRWGLSSASILTVAVRKENNSPPRAQAGGRHALLLPNNRITLDGSRDCVPPVDPGRPEPSRADAIGASDRTAAVRLTHLVEGVYTFHLQVADSQGTADTDTATGEVPPDPRKSGLVKLVLQVCVGQLTGQQKDMLVRQLTVDVQVPKIQAHSGLRAAVRTTSLRVLPTSLITATVFSVQTRPPSVVLEAADVVRGLHRQLPEEKEDFLLFTVLRVDTDSRDIYGCVVLDPGCDCLLECSGHGHCDPVTKLCVCSPLWMENLMECYLRDRESNCGTKIILTLSQHEICSMKSPKRLDKMEYSLRNLRGSHPSDTNRGLVLALYLLLQEERERTEIRKNTRYAILDNMDDQDRTELRPKYRADSPERVTVSEHKTDRSMDDAPERLMAYRVWLATSVGQASRAASIRHRSTEHNSSLMVSESEFDSDRDTIFS